MYLQLVKVDTEHLTSHLASLRPLLFHHYHYESEHAFRNITNYTFCYLSFLHIVLAYTYMYTFYIYMLFICNKYTCKDYRQDIAGSLRAESLNVFNISVELC